MVCAGTLTCPAGVAVGVPFLAWLLWWRVVYRLAADCGRNDQVFWCVLDSLLV
jgi:hypothetical protein